MCGRYTAAKDFGELIKLVGVVMARVPFFAPRYNIAPSQMAPVIYYPPSSDSGAAGGGPAVKLMRWGLIPADSFFEWKEMHGERQPFRVMLKSGEPFCFAGLWDRWVKPPAAGKFDTDLDEAPPSETIDSFTIITRPANAAIAPLHDRMPVIIPPNHYGWWLKDDDGRSESHKMALGHPLEEPMKIYPVSDLVNSPKTDDARCIEPVRIDRDFFERQWWGDG